jgi:tetratricopeptide (TPR) repeat protein
MEGSMELAELLSDVGINVWDRGLVGDGEKILNTAERVLDDMQAAPDNPIRASIHIILGLILDDVGITRRKEALERRQKAFEIRQKILDAIPVAERTVEDEILYFNALNDLSCSYQQFNRFDEIEANCTACYTKYQQWGDEDKVPYEYGKYHHQMAFVYAARGQTAKAVESGRRAAQLMEKASAASMIILMYRYDLANIMYQNGDSKGALAEHEKVLEKRLLTCGKANNLTLQSYLALGILHSYQQDYKTAL